MDLLAIHEELGEALSTVDGLRVLPYAPGSVSPPVAFFAAPDALEYSATYGNTPMTRLELPVTVAVGKVSDRASRIELMAYASTVGAKSVKATLENYPYTACDVVFVSDAEFGVITIASIDYLAVTFTVQVFGA